MNEELQKILRKVKARVAVAGIALLLAMVALAVLWNQSIKEELAHQATTFVRRGIQSGGAREMISILNSTRLASFSSVTHFDRDNKRVVTLPASVAPIAYADLGIIDRIFFAEASTVIFLDDEERIPIGSLSFVYPRFGLAHYAFLFWLFAAALLGIPLIKETRRVRENFLKEFEIRKSRNAQELVRKMRHNIRSPLAVLSAYFSAPGQRALELHEQGRRATARIEEVLSELAADPGTQLPDAMPAIAEVSMIVDQIVEEKKLLSPGRALSFRALIGTAANGTYSRISAAELKATISNILDNSLQATAEMGNIEVALEADGHLITITVSDNGRGIPREFLSKVTEKGFTFGKEGGSGIGLYYAKKLMDEQGGNIVIESRIGEGTKVSLFFPQQPSPSWHCREIQLSGVERIHVFDDQETILEVFRQRLAALPGLKAQFHTSAESLLQLNDIGERDFFLMDFDFGENRLNGLEAIKRKGIANRAVLVTGHFDDPAIQSACSMLGCKLLPKDQIRSVLFV